MQIGAGPNRLQGWLNTDYYVCDRQPLVPLNATRPFPIPDAVFDYVFSEHLIEHLSYESGLSMLRECHRVLKPGGMVRVATPALETLLAIYSPDRTPIQDRYVRWASDQFVLQATENPACFVINNAFHNWGHQFLYDQPTLKRLLERAGFEAIVPQLPGESDDDNLRGIEWHGRDIGDEEINRFETLVLEARRPS